MPCTWLKISSLPRRPPPEQAETPFPTLTMTSHCSAWRRSLVCVCWGVILGHHTALFILQPCLPLTQVLASVKLKMVPSWEVVGVVLFKFALRSSVGVSACFLNYFANSLGSTVVCFLSGITDCGMDVAMKHLIRNTRTAHHGVKFSPLPCHLEHSIWQEGEKILLFSSISSFILV